MTSKKLDAREKRFVSEYPIDLDPKRAAIDAGYSKTVAQSKAYQWVSNSKVKPHVYAAIQEALTEREERTKITQDWVLQTILETVERCKQARPVLDRKGDPVFIETPTGNIVPAYAFDSGAVLRGAELAGKHLRMFSDKIELTGKDGGPVQHQNVGPNYDGFDDSCDD